MVNGVNPVLTDAPRVSLAHVSGGGNNQCQRLPVHLIVVISMPRTVHRKVVGPYLGHSVGVASRRSRLRGCDGSDHQANGEDDSVDHGKLMHLGLMDHISTVRGQTGCPSGCTSEELSGHSQEVPVKIARCLAKGWVIVGSPSPIHAATAVIMIVELILMRVQHVVWVEGLVRVKGVSHVWWNGHGRQVHLGVGSIGRALGIEVVEKVGLSVFPLNSRCDVTYVAFVGDLFFGLTIVFICRSGGCEGNAQGQGDPRVGKRSDFHRFGSTVNVARACRRLKWVGIQPVGWRSIPAAFVPRRKKIRVTAQNGNRSCFKKVSDQTSLIVDL